jgi:two-component system response regulator DegU
VLAISGMTRLTGRELEVARWAARGASNHAIAMQLGLSEQTVKNHLSSAFHKLSVQNRVQLTLRIIQNLSEHPVIRRNG